MVVTVAPAGNVGGENHPARLGNSKQEEMENSERKKKSPEGGE